MSVRVRIAPSPTGNLHIGTARTALFNWLFARKHGGEFILRIEDTDLERSKPEFEQNIVDGLRWLGLDWDNDQLYRQRERLPVYRKYLEKLLEQGRAVERTYTDEEKAAIAVEGREPRDRIIVLQAPEPHREIPFDDLIRGTVSVEAKHVGSIALAKDLDTPLYNFAVVVDDLEMGITHVIRGEDHISNTPKQLLIYEALDAKPPIFAHLPLILGPDRSKMSKRHGATSIAEYQKDYLPEAILNFMASLGYTYEPELLARDEMIHQFDLEKVHRSGAVFDQKKLDWINAQYIKQLSLRVFKDRIGKPDLPDVAVPFMTERLERLSSTDAFSYFWQEPVYDVVLLHWKNDPRERTMQALALAASLAEKNALTGENLDQVAVDSFDGQKGSVYWPLRVALSGQKNSVGPLDIAAVIGPEETRRRIEVALKKLQ